MAQGSGEVREGPVPTARAGADAAPPAPTTDEIRSQIEHTRAEMSDTIDAIQTRLSPKRVLADAKDSVSEATVGRVRRLTQRTNGAGGRVLETLRDNPLPVALLATASAGLVLRALTNRKRRSRHETTLPIPGQHDGPDPAWTANETMTTRGRNRRLLAAAGAGAACWAIWRGQAAASRFGHARATGANSQGGGL